VTLRVLIADDEAMVRAGLVALLRSDPAVEVIGEAADGQEALDLAHQQRPDVALIDVRMPIMDGLATTSKLRELVPGTQVVILTTFDHDVYVVEALKAGASGFLLKSAPPTDLLAAVHTAARGDAIIAPSATRRLIDRFVAAHDTTTTSPPPQALALLTDREREVLILLARGLTNQGLAQELHVTEATVKTHVSNILAKLGLETRVQAAIAAYETGLVRPRNESSD
jgi:DNA-binding NarL/FixJ family response regulator